MEWLVPMIFFFARRGSGFRGVVLSEEEVGK